MQPLYIDNGVNIDASWYGHIAVSYDGVNWTTLAKEGLSVKPRLKGNNTTNPPGVFGASSLIETRITLSDFAGSTLFEFECNNVVNQATWQGKTAAALRTAVDDLTTWIGELYNPGGSAFQSEFMEVLIQDANGDLFFMVRTLDEATGVYTVSYINADGSAAVPVAPLQPYGGSNAAVHAEDSGHTTGDFGVQMLGVRNDNAATAFSNTNGDYTPIAVDDNGRVFVYQDQAVAAGENHLGSIGGNTFTLAVTQTTNASAYEAGDAVGGKVTITNAMRVSGGTGVLQSLQIIDKGNQKAALEILIFDSDPAAATITDDTAFVYSTDITKQIARISVSASDYVTLNSIATASLGGLSLVVKASGSTNLYAAIVTTGTPTYTSTSDIIVTFGILQD